MGMSQIMGKNGHAHAHVVASLSRHGSRLDALTGKALSKFY